jgi:hypothetical protein
LATWIGYGAIDARAWGATCGSADSTTALQALATFLAAKGGTMLIGCPMTIAGQLTLGNSVKMQGVGPIYYAGMQSTPSPSVWPPTAGPAINCTSTTLACISISSLGVEISHINFGNPQSYPPSSGTWTPTVYPYVIATVNNSGWQGLNLHDLTFTSTSNAIDLEGLSNYSTTFTGAQFEIDNIWFNAVLNTGILFHQIDNTGTITRIHATPDYALNVASMGAYQRANFVEFRMHYAAAEQFSDIECFAAQSCFEFENATVTNNFGSLTFAASALSITNLYVNQTCQAMTAPNGNGTVMDATLIGVHIWGDQSGFHCSEGLAEISLPTNDANVSVSHAMIYVIDTFANVGCGSGCNPGGGAILRMDDLDVDTYSYYSAGQNFVNAPSGSAVSFGTTNLAAIRPCSSGCFNSGSWTPGKIMGPGPDATQSYMGQIGVGGGTKALEGAVILGGGGSNATLTGGVSFYSVNNSLQAFIQGDSSGDLSADAQGGSIFFKINNASIFSVGVVPSGPSAGKAHINLGILPTSCTGLTTGDIWDNSNVIQACP